MAILTDTTSIIIEFQWEDENNPSIKLLVKYHVDNGKPFISVSEDNKEWMDFPAAFFTETVDFVSKQKSAASLFNQSQSKKSPVLSSLVSSTTQQKSKTLLPQPIIERKVNDQGQLEPMDIADVNPLESLSELEGASEAVPTGEETKEKKELLKKKRRDQAKEEVASRQVIHGDEKMAKMLRGANTEKSIKRIE